MARLGAMIMRDIAPEDAGPMAARLAPGLDDLWIVEDLSWAGGISQLGSVLAATDTEAAGRPRVGHGIAPAPFRTPAALAMEWATIDRLHPDRLVAGLGHGLQDWMRQLGEAVDSPLTLLRETIESVQQLLAGGPTNYDGRYISIENVELVFPPPRSIPVMAGVLGPRSLQLSGQVADGTILPEGTGPQALTEIRTRIDEGRSEAGRTDPHEVVVFTGLFFGNPGDLPPPPTSGPPGWAAIGPDAAAVAESMQALIDAGADTVVVVPFGSPEEMTRRFVDEVAPLLDR